MICSVRHQGKPLLQPTYNFRDVPPAARGFTGSTLSEIHDRQHFVDSIAELTLLCSEASRRRKNLGTTKKSSSKPLSIEYIFDRIDTDDPLWGFMLRTDTPMSATGRASTLKASPQWRRGMLQGFISVTTFTTWKSSFRFDSLHEEAFSWDEDHLEKEMENGERRWDEDGRLAMELESTVHGGDPYIEGVVYPRIAEISLLGGLGCGKQLLKLVIEKLERLKATSSRNYDYVVLQATENSIPFYESMGFTRVGCIQGKAPSPTGYASSPVVTYVVQKEWEKPVDIAKQFGVDVLDVEFLNIPVWGPTFKKNVWLKKGTQVFIPLISEKETNTANTAIKWYTAKEDETPRGIAMKHKVKYADFIAANQRKYPDLVGNSRLKQGTRIQVSRFDIDDSDYMPYPHWTFPDDGLDEETNEPSYMMALKLNREFGKAADNTPVKDSLVEIQPYSPESSGVKELLMEPKVNQIKPIVTKPRSNAKEPKKPKRPPTPYLLFSTHIRATKKGKFMGKSFVESNKMISEMWRSMSDEEKSPFQKQFDESKSTFVESMRRYERDLAIFDSNKDPSSPGRASAADTSLLEQVVKLKSSKGLPGFATKYEYFYVLTYIPDLLWVHLIPMRKVGVFDKKHPCADRPIWMVVSEDEGKEFDTSAAICKPVSSRTVNNSADADEEQWDICDDTPPLAPIFTAKKSALDSEQSNSARACTSLKANTREKSSQPPSTLKKPKKTPLATVSKIPQTALKMKGQRSNNAAASESKKQRTTAGRPQHSALENQSTMSSIASKVMLGTCSVKVRLFGRVFDSLHSLEDTESGYDSSLQSAIKSGSIGEVFLTKQETKCRSKSNNPPQDIQKPPMHTTNWLSNGTPKRIRRAPKKFVARPSRQGVGVEEGDAAFLDASLTPSSTFVDVPSQAPLHARDCKLAPIFTKKYTRSSTQMQKSASLNSPSNQSVCNRRRSSRGKQDCNTRRNQNTFSAVVSDDGLSATSQELYVPHRKKVRIL